MSPRFNRSSDRKSGDRGGRFGSRGGHRGRGRRFAELKIHEIDYRRGRGEVASRSSGRSEGGGAAAVCGARRRQRCGPLILDWTQLTALRW